MDSLPQSLDSYKDGVLGLFCNRVDRLIALVSLPLAILFNISSF